jgi:LacI family transcriptional regulator
VSAISEEKPLLKAGYNVIVCNTGGSMSKNRSYIRNLIEKQVDGLLLVGSIFTQIQEDSSVMDILREVPVVLTNGRLDLPNAYSVMVNDELGIRLAVDHLADKGHRNIVYIKDLHTDSARRKTKGYLSAMRERGLEAHVRTLETTYGMEGGHCAAQELLAEKRAVDGVVCGEDFTALGVVKALSHAGVRIPGDMAVVGYNNSDYARICTPELTTVDNKVDTFSLLSVQLLRTLIEGGVRASMVVEPELVIRQSS